MDISFEIERLVNYAIQKQLIKPSDETYIRNIFLDMFKVNTSQFPKSFNEISELSGIADSPTEILDNILDYCARNEILKNDTITERDLFDSKIMGVLLDKPSQVNNKFYSLYKDDKKKATDYFYNFAIDSNYIRMDRINKNLYWVDDVEYGELEITINLSKPEKNPKDIEKAKSLPQTGYPKCLLCRENEGFAGNLNHPARQNLRLINLELNNKSWFLQYSPYIYYNEHCIVINENHTPMEINKNTFINFIEFLDFLPHYFIGSNTDIPIVGGSILSHDHYQGGRHIFPLEKAPAYEKYNAPNRDINISLIKWPMSVIRISSKNKDEMINLSEFILNEWKNYSDIEADIISHTNETRHNAITPIGRINKNGEYEFDLVLRNNRTTAEFELGIFHPHENLHHIKKENIGLIEVMGLAILPERLLYELDEIENIISGMSTTELSKIDNENCPLSKHNHWIVYLIEKYGFDNTKKEAKEIIKKETSIKFWNVLKDAGVFKDTEKGKSQFAKFVDSLGFTKL